MKKFLMMASLMMFISVSSAGCASPIESMDDPRINLENFKFTDYSRTGIIRFAKKYFPVGTKKDFVDSILIEQGKAKQTARRYDRPDIGLSEIYYHYSYNDLSECTIVVILSFDKNDFVQGEARLAGGCL